MSELEKPIQAEEATAQDGGENPLVMEDVKGGKITKKTKKASTPKKNSLDMIAKLKEQEQNESQATAAIPAEDPNLVGLRIFNESGEGALKEEARKCLQEQNKMNRDLQKERRRTDQITKEKDRKNIEVNEHKTNQQKAQIKCLELQKHIKTLKEAASKMYVPFITH